MKELNYLHQIIFSEPALQGMLETLKERKELDVAFTHGEGEDGSALALMYSFHSLCCTSTGSNDMSDILRILGPTCHKFHELGRGLNLEGSVMDVILYEANHSTPYDSLVRVLTKWLNWNYPLERFGKPSLSLLVKAVYTYDCRLAVGVFETFTAAAGEPRLAC